MTPRSIFTLLTAATLCTGVAIAAPLRVAQASTTDLYVSPDGSDRATGTTSAHPYKTIQTALDHASPGSIIHLARGSYHEAPVTKVNGTAAQRITIEGASPAVDPGARDHTVLYGSGHVFTINNSYYRLKDFTIDGEEGIPRASYPDSLAAAASFKNSVQDVAVDSTLIFVGAADTARNLTGIMIEDMDLRDAGGDCVRIRGGANHNEITGSTIEWCGILGKQGAHGEYAYHNGEGVYIGTSPKSTDQPTHVDDTSSYNYVRNNVIHTFGSECFDVKENAHNNTFENNTCGDNDEPLVDEGSNVELRGYANAVLNNTIRGSLGYGLKLATDSSRYQQGRNVVQGNEFSNDVGSPITNSQTTAQGLFCGNSFTMRSYLSGRSVGAATNACSPG